MKRAVFRLALLALLLTACANDSAVSKTRTVPDGQLGRGIYRLPDLADSRSLVWSPKEDVFAGLIGVPPYPLPDCIPGPWACWLEGLFAPQFRSEIFLVDFAAATRTRVIRTPTDGKIISNIFWMPDGQHIGYIVDVSPYQQDNGTWSISTQGLNDQRISEERLDPVWSPDGTQFAVAQDGSVFVAREIGDKGRRIYHSELFQPYFEGMSWSANGKTIAFSIGKESAERPDLRPRLFLLNVATGGVSGISGDILDESRYPVFSPVDDLLVYERRQPPFFKTTTVIRDLKTNCQVELPIPDVVPDASWSPDGTRLLVRSFGDKYRGYYIIDLKEFLGPKFAATGSICP